MKKREVKKVLLVNPPNNILKDSARRISEPLGLLYIGAALKNNGYEVSVFDMPCEGYDNCISEGNRIIYGSTMNDLKAKVAEYSPNVVGVTCMFTSRERNVLEVCSVLREANPDMIIVVGGIHPSLYPERFLHSGYVDYVILGEGEFRMVHLLNCIKSDEVPQFDGVAFLNDGKAIIQALTQRIRNLDVIPYPDRTLIDMEKYIRIGTPFAPFPREERVATILTTRGCPNNCNFCATVHYWGRKLRKRSVDNIIGELKELRDLYDIREIQFADDNMTADTRFAKNLFRKMKPLKFKLCTPTGLYFNSLDPELISLMAEAGAYQITVAIESASERVLRDIIRKKVNLRIVKKLIEEAHKYDIGVHGMFIVGFPGEKREEIMMTFDFPFQVGFDSVSFFMANPLPGSDLYRECEEKGYLREDYSPMDLKIANIHIPVDSEDYFMDPDELVKLAEEKTREFNDWSRNMYPERWKKKFELYLKKYPEQREMIFGRVT